jgi:hypothetical protein
MASRFHPSEARRERRKVSELDAEREKGRGREKERERERERGGESG